MSTLPNRLLSTVVALTILVPSVLLSQVKIKEKVEIQPKPPAHAARIGGIYDFYSPPLFITDAFVLSLKSAVTITGTVDVSDQIGYFQSADVSYVVYDYFDPSVFYGTAVAWKGREPAAWGGHLYEGQQPCTDTLEAGTTPDVELLLGFAGFDGFGARQFIGSESALDFSFTGMRTKLDGSPAPVTGTAHVIGSVVPSARFSGWKIEARPPFLGCGQGTLLSITPLDGSGAQYSPAALELMSGSFTVSVRAKGSYACLEYGDQEGGQVTITIPQEDECILVLDTRRGDIPGGLDTAIVTVTGGGKSVTLQVTLRCEGGLHFDFGYVQDVQHGQSGWMQPAILDASGNYVDNPPEHYFKFELLGDAPTWGTLYDVDTWRRGSVLDSVASTYIEFDPWGKEPQSPTQVSIRISAENGTIPSATATFMVLPPQMRAVAGKSTLSYGDTTSLRLQVRYPDGPWMDKPTDWTGNYYIAQADTFGYLYNADSSKSGICISDTLPVIYYYAKPESEPDSIEVLIPLMSQESGSSPVSAALQSARSSKLLQRQANVPQFKVSARGTKKMPPKTLGGGVPGGGEHYGLARLKVRKSEILLGETKYYYVKDDGDGNLSIEETTDSTRNPGVQQNVWQGSPVTVVIDGPNSGKKLGVYWEKKAPGGSLLLPGMVRLVGRYWHADSVYRVNLIATYSGNPSRTIEVKKPVRLFDQNVFDKPFNTTQNIKDAALNIDSLCIWYGGTIGIPPQVIKGQMFRESYHVRNRFDPSYRYEPWADYGFAHGRYSVSYSSQPFWVTGAGTYAMGEGKAIPLDHKNVEPVYYPTGPISIADYITDPSNWPRYFTRETREFVGLDGSSRSDNLTKRFREYCDKWYYVYLLPIGKGALDAAIDLIQRDIRKKYTDYAQTRKAASYGLIQMLYTTAIESRLGFNRGKSISNSSAPEELNDETIEMPFYRTFTEKNLKLEFGAPNAIVPNDSWPKGWEQTWMNSLARYNKKEGYPASVFDHARKFYPQED